MISQPPYVWYHIQYTCDILCSIFMTSYSPCMTTQHCVLLIPHSAYVWHHLHYRWYHIHSITPNHSIYDITSTSGMTSHPLYQTLHPLYLCHHSLSTDIIPTFVWHHTYYMCGIICNLYNIISTPYVITLLYLWHHSLYIWNHIQYVGPHIHYTCDITAINRCHHTQSIDNITYTLYDITYAIHVASLRYTKHHNLPLWHQATLFLTSHPLYLTSYPLYLCHHIQCIDDITPIEFWDLIRYIWWHHIHCIWHHSHWMCLITTTLSMMQHPLYVGHHTHSM